LQTRIVVPDDFPSVFAGSAAEQELRRLGAVNVVSERGADREDELARRVADAEVVLTLRAHAKFSRRVLDAAPRLRMISIWGTGFEHVDIATCRSRGIVVSHTPGANAHAVAEHTVALMLAVLRRIPEMHLAVRAVQWPRETLSQLEGKTVGIIGLGAIGRRVSELVKPFGARVLEWSRRGSTTIETLLAESDVVTLHLRLTPETTNFLNRSRLALMKPTAILINTARGALVEHEALMSVLREGRIAGAGLDVFHTEPIPAVDPVLSLPNVVLTPHNAGTTPESVATGLHIAVDNVASYLSGSPKNVVPA